MAEATWKNEGQADGYTVWSRPDGTRSIYNVTSNGEAPSAGSGGYGSLSYILMVKGIAVEDLRRV
jgi:hypothetical protein